MQIIALTFADGYGCLVRITTPSLGSSQQLAIIDRIKLIDPRAGIQMSNSLRGLIILPSRARTTTDELRENFVRPVAEVLGIRDIEWTDELYAELH